MIVQNIRIAGPLGKLNLAVHINNRRKSLGVVIISHGFRGSKDGGGRATFLAEKLCQFDLVVVRYDFTPNQNLSNQIAELSAVEHFTRSAFGPTVMLLGRSMGGVASLIYGSGLSKLIGMCLWATPLNLHQTFSYIFGEQYEQLCTGKSAVLVDENGPFRIDPEFVDDFLRYKPIDYVTNLNVASLLVIHGTADCVVPVAQARLLYQLANCNKQLVEIDGGDHQFSQHGEQAINEVSKWTNMRICQS